MNAADVPWYDGPVGWWMYGIGMTLFFIALGFLLGTMVGSGGRRRR